MNRASAAQILIIDDDESYKKLLVRRLHSFLPNAVITEFGSLAAARKSLDKEPKRDFDLVILDEHLPDGRGVELLEQGCFQDLAVLTISSDSCPDTVGRVVGAGARFFLSKLQISEPLFEPLVRGIMDRNKIQRDLDRSRDAAVQLDTVQKLVATLRHEINNPLGAVLGAAYLMKESENVSPEQLEAARLVEDSGKRIKHVLDKLCETIAVDTVKKANQEVFHIPGDAPWESGNDESSEE